MKKASTCGVDGQVSVYLAQFLLAYGYRVLGTSRDAQCGRHHNLVIVGIAGKVSVESMALNHFLSVL